MSDCPICLNELPEELQDRITCPSCNEVVCNTCFESYLLSRDQDIVVCHSCDKPWSEDFIDDNTYDEFRNGALRAHRTKILVDQEAARLPALQDRAHRFQIANRTSRRKRPTYVQEIINSYGQPANLRMVVHTDDCFFCNHDTVCPGGPLRPGGRYCHNCFENRSRLQNCPNRRDAALYAQQREEIEALFGPGSCTGSAPPQKKVFRACPLGGCRGFLDEFGKCGMCEKQLCLKCHELNNDGHECDPATVATVKLLARETKPCPNCHASIYKIDGCDQMWCTQCQTPFSWLTGLKEEGRVHNPHYYEWMRRTQGSVPREPGDAPCRDGQLRNDFRLPNETDEHLDRLVFGIRRFVAEQLQYNRPPAPNEESLNRIGIKYLVGEFNKKEWARRVYIEKRQQKRLQGQYDIVRAFASAATDLLNAMDMTTAAGIKVTVKALADLMVYMEEALNNLYARYFYTGAGISIIPNWDKITQFVRFADLSKICGRDINKITDIDCAVFTKYVDWTLTA